MLSLFFWQGHKDLNPEPTVLEAEKCRKKVLDLQGFLLSVCFCYKICHNSYRHNRNIYEKEEWSRTIPLCCYFVMSVGIEAIRTIEIYLLGLPFGALCSNTTFQYTLHSSPPLLLAA